MINMKKRFAVLLLFFSAVLLMGYPYLANYVFEHETASLVNSVEKIEEMTDDTEKEERKKSVKQYNEKLFSNGVKLCCYSAN